MRNVSLTFLAFTAILYVAAQRPDTAFLLLPLCVGALCTLVVACLHVYWKHD
jgi:uncharacterized membrane protein